MAEIILRNPVPIQFGIPSVQLEITKIRVRRFAVPTDRIYTLAFNNIQSVLTNQQGEWVDLSSSTVRFARLHLPVYNIAGIIE